MSPRIVTPRLPSKLSHPSDTLMQPVEHSYTVASLNELAQQAGLQIELPCLDQFNRARGSLDWNLQFASPELDEPYRKLSDLERWQVTNLLLCERSPLLWFYLRRPCPSPRATEEEICQEFLKRRFTRNIFRRRGYTLGADDHYHATPGSIEYPPPAGGPYGAAVVDADGTTCIRDILERHQLPTQFPVVNLARLRLTSTAFPYLRAVSV